MMFDFLDRRGPGGLFRRARLLAVLAAGFLSLLALPAPLFAARLAEPAGVSPARPPLAGLLEQDPLKVLDRASPKRRARILEAAFGFYAQREWRFAWTEDGAAAPGTDRVVRTLEGAAGHGLRPADYRVEELCQRLTSTDGRPATEAAATLSLLLYAEHLSRGRLDPADYDPEWNIEPRQVDLASALERFAQGQALETVAPSARGYQELRGLLRQGREQWARGEELPPVPEGEAIEPTGRYQPERLKKLAERLAAEGALPPEAYRSVFAELATASAVAAPAEPPRETAPPAAAAAAGGQASAPGTDPAGSVLQPCPPALIEAIERFQQRRGVTADGKAGRKTLALLNESLESRLERVVLNLERWRWMPDLPKDRYLWVNLPAFRLEAFEAGRRVLEMPVVVGKPDWKTPLNRGSMTDVVINPDWDVPIKIALQETIPKIRKDRDYLAKQGIDLIGPDGSIVDPATVDWEALDAASLNFRLRQRPGPKNALGQVKFLFPNQQSVCIHDTPERDAFDRTQRDLSHGCVRVESPLALAELVFARTSDWDMSQTRSALQGQTQKRVRLSEDMPVWLVYFTAYRGADGRLWLREDIYGYDRQLAETLRKRYGAGSFLPAPKPTAAASG
jgi:murein L,D-transpeptidase YcbB/YkuD